MTPPDDGAGAEGSNGRVASHEAASPGDGATLEATLDAICEVLRLQVGHDFTSYKRTTLGRRVERRISACRATSPSSYLEILRADAQEAKALLRELLISVTEFFRDPEALAALAESLEPLLRASDEPIRVWVPGCATGEEAYSIAILLCEGMGALPRTCQIFATDIDLAALEVARSGRYPETISERVSESRLSRFFFKRDGVYYVRKELRDMCVFSAHNVLNDPPFSRLHLISCRNLLIYFEAALQAKLIPVFHYALRPGGQLFLGTAETIGESTTLFEPLDPAHRLYRPRETGRRRELSMPIAATRPAAAHAAPQRVLGNLSEPTLVRTVERALLDDYAPPGVVVTQEGEVVYLCGDTSTFLEAPRGSAPFDLFAMLRPSLLQELRSCLARAAQSKDELVTPEIELPVGEQVQRARLVVRPLRGLGAEVELFLVAFQAIGALSVPSPGVVLRTEEPRVEILERELRSTRELWHGTTRALEISNEDLRSSNEEYQVLNEELQTSKEELQSTNEELRTVNGELQKKVEALDAAHADLQNLFDSADVATLLLDRSLRIRRFSPSAAEVFFVIAADVGRPLTDIAMRLADLDLRGVVGEVLATLRPVERSVRRAEDDRRYLLRALPYRTLTGEVSGVVLTFIDVTTLERAQESERSRAEELQALLDALPAAVFMTSDPEALRITANRSALTGLGIGSMNDLGGDALHGRFRMFHEGVELAPGQLAIHRAARGETLRDFEVDVVEADGRRRTLFGNAEPLRGPTGQPRGAVAAFVDVTKRVAAETALRESEERYRALASTAHDFIARFDPELRYLYANPAALERMQRSLDVVVGKTVTDLGFTTTWEARLRPVFESAEPARFDWQPYGDRVYDVQLSPEIEGERVVSVVMVSRDITEQRRAERALRESEQRYAAMFGGAAFAIALTQLPSGLTLAVNPAFERMFEIAAVDVIGRTSLDLGLAEPGTRGRVAEELEARGCVRGFECVRYKRSGELVHLSLNVDPIRVDGDTLCVTTIEDITERVLAEDARRQAEGERARLERKLGQAQKMEAIGTLAGGVAHDFNNILGGILGGLSLLELELGREPRLKRDLEEMQALALRGAEVTKQLLGFARGGKYDVRPLDLARVVRATAEMFGRTRRDLMVELALPVDLRCVMMDHTQLEQVLLNLFVNAGHAMGSGGHLTVRAENVPSDDPSASPRVSLVVEDDGVGMDAATRARVFEPFFTTREPGEGTGLGLASVFGIVTHHGGEIEVESEPGRGTTFRLLLPATDERPPSGNAGPAIVRGKGTLLVVDDEPQVLRTCCRLLERIGYTVLQASSGKQAVEIVRERGAEIALVLLDMTMPDLSGAKTFDAMRALAPTLKVLLASGFGIEHDAQETLDRGAAGFIQKPFTAAQLSTKLAELV